MKNAFDVNEGSQGKNQWAWRYVNENFPNWNAMRKKNENKLDKHTRTEKQF